MQPNIELMQPNIDKQKILYELSDDVIIIMANVIILHSRIEL